MGFRVYEPGRGTRRRNGGTVNRAQASAVVGGFSDPGKMPGPGYSLPPEYCRTGSALRAVPGSVCSRCYALRHRYRFPNVRAALQRRYDILTRTLSAGPGSDEWRVWIEAFSTLAADVDFFRFHDSGDLQSARHLRLYADAARAVPGCTFWIPTKERGIIRRFPAADVPDNLRIRVSANMLDRMPRGFPLMSAVYRDPESAPWGFRCPSHKQGNRCGDCRACWNSDVPVVVYRYH